MNQPTPPPNLEKSPRDRPPSSPRDRSLPRHLWYRLIQLVVSQIIAATAGIRASGRENIPKTGGALLLSNHLSHLDVFVLGLLLHRTLNFVARSTLFKHVLGPLLRSVGAFPIQRDGSGAQGLKETLRRLRNGAIVTFFPEGTRSRDGSLAPLKPGVAALASRARVPIIPAGLAGTFESWPRSHATPRSHPVRVHYGRPILPSELQDLETDAVLALLSARLEESILIARQALQRDLDPWGETSDNT